MASDHGIEGFCYWHYWFGNGERVLESVFEEVLKSGQPDFPFCLGWANESWTGKWHGLDDQVIFEQTYHGVKDYTDHFYSVLPAFKDSRYIKVHNKPLFLVYRPMQLPDPKEFTETWQILAVKEGFTDGLYFIGVHDDMSPEEYGFSARLDASLTTEYNKIKNSFFKKLKRNLFHIKYPDFIDYEKLVGENLHKEYGVQYLPLLVPNWDNTPRSGYNGRVFINDTIEKFDKWLKHAIDQVSAFEREERIVFIKSWNEWAEGNYMEPDRLHGFKYLEVVKKAIYPDRSETE